jgi:hypothetical protein
VSRRRQVAIKADDDVVAGSRAREVERLLGRKTIEKSTESNGVSEAVKTHKGDYPRVPPRPDALTVLAQLSAWGRRLQPGLIEQSTHRFAYHLSKRSKVEVADAKRPPSHP